MSTRVATAPAALPADSSSAPGASKALALGGVGIVLTLLGLFISGPREVAMSWLVGLTYWTAVALGMLLMIMIHHVFDASWSVVIRRQWEHSLAAFKWLAILFLPLLLATWFYDRGLIWGWMSPDTPLHGHGTVGTDVLYQKKSGFLNINMFTGMTIAFFLIWIWLSARLRKASFRQDADGDPGWTHMNRKTAAFGIPLTGILLTAAAIYWLKSLEYHWFSTMYGVWFFANCVRGALCISVILMIWLYNRGDYKGILNTNHLHSIGQLMLAFTVFWGYVTFSQYFLIWNANVPEETFWYNIREYGDWWWVGMVILFGHFALPFVLLLSYRFKITHRIIRRIAYCSLTTILIDICYNSLPAMKDAAGNPLPFLSLKLVWVLTSVLGVGGVCAWAYLRSFPTAKLIPVRDPRIVECLTHHD